MNKQVAKIEGSEPKIIPVLELKNIFLNLDSVKVNGVRVRQ